MRLLVTGAAGMLGQNLVEQLALQRADAEVIPVTRQTVDLTDKAATRALFERERPDAIIHAAAKVGGIAAKLEAPTDYLLDNLLIDSSVLSAAIDLRVPEVLYIGSAAVYPAAYERPFVESDILGGPLEDANEGYALSKIAAIKTCEYATRQYGLAFKVALPSNLYGVHDHFALASAHLVAATLVKVHEAKASGSASIDVWGDGTARREFTFCGDLAGWLATQAGALAAWPDRLNLGYGQDHAVRTFYEVAQQVVGYGGELVFDTTKPSGVPQRLIDSSAARALGWNPRTSIEDGMAATYADFLASSVK